MPEKEERMRKQTIVAVLLVGGLFGCRCPSTPARAPDGSCLPRGDEVRVAMSALPNTLDWSLSSQASAENYPVLHAMMRGLTVLDATNAPAPGIADHWEIEADSGTPPKQTYTFHLKAGLVWSDGKTPVTARDFVFGWRRALLGREPAEFGDSVGAEQVIEARAKHGPPEEVQHGIDAALAGFEVRAADDLTLRVTLRSPRSYFLSRLAYVYPFFPQPAALLEGLNSEEIRKWFNEPGVGHPVVLGAFRPVSWDKLGKTVRLEQNPFDAEAPQEGAVKKLLLLEAALAPILYAQCQVDFLLMDDASTLATAPPDLAHTELLSTYFLGMNAKLVPLPLRQAIGYALDRGALAAGLLPTVRTARTYLPPAMPAALAPDDPRTAAFPDFDPGKAKALVAASGYAGETLTLLVRNSKTFLPEKGLADGVRRQLEAVGIHVRIVESANFTNDIQTPDGTPRHPLFLKRVGADYAHPQTLFTPFQADGINYTAWKSIDGGAELAAFQDLLDRGAAETDVEKMRDLYAEADRMLVVKDAVIAPILHPDRYFRKRPWIEGLGVDAFNFLTLRSMRLKAAPAAADR
jgi:ABC-type transport system substrate-binding protein